MTGETDRTPSSWTPDTLKVLEDEKIEALRQLFLAELRRIDQILGDRNRAQDKFEETVQRDSVKQNEFRGSLDDLGRTMATRRETETQFASMTARVDEIAKEQSALRSRIDVGPAQLSAIQTQQDQQLGRQEGIRVSTSTLYMLVAIVGVIAGLLGHFVGGG